MIVLNTKTVEQLFEDLGRIVQDVAICPSPEWLQSFAARWISKLNEVKEESHVDEGNQPSEDGEPGRQIWIKPEDDQDAIRMIKSLSLVLVLWEAVSVRLRSKLKYGHEFKTADEALEWCRDMLFEEMNERGIDLDELVH